MKDLTNDNEWIWDKNKFINRKYIMQELYQNYTDGDDWDVEKVMLIFAIYNGEEAPGNIYNAHHIDIIYIIN